jgi:flagellar hook-associated protein 3 FlgL
MASAGEPTPLSVDGEQAWLLAPDPANPPATLSSFAVLDSIVADLLTPNRPPAAVAQTVAEGVRRIDAVSDNLQRWRARAGESLNRIDAIGERIAQTRLDAQRERSEAEDLDMVQAISEFQTRQTGYDAALKTYATVQRMSLFEYIR